MYGITLEDIQGIDQKIEFQKTFLKNFNLELVDKDINMLENTYSANLNPKKYFAEINNRVNTMVENAKDKGLKPVFVTITAPSKFHKKFDDGTYQIEPNETAKTLTQIFNKFTNLKIFQRMKKELGHGLVYFRVYEPHKSGVPHLHAMLFLPVNYILPIKKKFKEYFSDKSRLGSNKKALDYRYSWYKEKGGAIGYIMKYILKSFEDTNKASVQHAVYWYIKHKVRRFLSSRTLAPLSMYRKIRYYFKDQFENDFKEISKLIKSGEIHQQFDGTMINYIYYCHEDGEIKDKILWSKNADLLLSQKTHIKSDTISLQYKKKEKKILPIHDYSSFSHYIPEKSSSWNGLSICPSKMTNYQLLNYYNKLLNTNHENINIDHFNVVKNEMIIRKMLKIDFKDNESSKMIRGDLFRLANLIKLNKT